LYNLATDRPESKDLAASEPAKVAELTKLYKAWDAEQAPPAAVDNPNKKGNGKKGKATQAA